MSLSPISIYLNINIYISKHPEQSLSQRIILKDWNK